MRIIPAIDIIEGKCVRLSKGDYATKKVYNENPLEVAKEFETHGIEFLHLVDLDGAKSSHIVNYRILEQIASKTNLKIDFGGGLKSDKDLKIAFESGANQITGGSIAVKDPIIFKKWLKTYGSDKIILGADANNEKVAISGWQEESDQKLIPFIQSYQQEGVQYVICTDIAKDGMLEGPSFELYKKILKKCNMFGRALPKLRERTKTDFSTEPVLSPSSSPRIDFAERLEGTNSQIKLIASGGISTFDEIPKLAKLGCEGTIIGKAIYENKISLKQLENYIIRKKV